ncbi:MAG TPA: sigma 54-interacting transcriptional regulator [Rhodopila sp.]|nr:sigma 54-interacting transcriptional regulator [Rhodopila sp.]
MARVSFDDLARVPAQRLARLLLDRAAEDPTLLARLYQTIDAGQKTRRHEPPAIVGDSPAMRRVTALVHRFEQTDEPVLITGESGTGKELLARAIHDGSRRSSGPFVAVNCAAIPAGLVASELFGYEKGAFTGAAARTIGQIEYANGGTLFLDEIGDMPIDLQGHLLRFLQEGQIRRVGGRDTIALDVRIVSATNVRLGQAIAEGRFRQDLFYRLNVLTLPVPPLRERAEDIAPLASHFLQLARRDFGRQVDGFSSDAMVALRRYRWPGNVRELMSVVRRAVVVGDGPVIEAATLIGLDDRAEATPVTATVAAKPGSPEERATLLATLERTGENITLTADALGVSRVTLYRMLRRHGIVLKRGMAEAPIVRRPQHAHG